MAALDSPRTNHGSAFSVARIFSFFGGVFGAVEAWRDVRMTRKALSDLTDHELADIGLRRGDIDLVAQSHFLR